MAEALEIAILHADDDEERLRQVEKAVSNRLKPLLDQGFVSIWHMKKITAGMHTEQEITRHLRSARIFLLLISPDFLAMDLSYSNELRQLVQRHTIGEVCLVPIILRPVYWTNTPFGALKPLPDKEKPLSRWSDRDDGLFNIAEGVQQVVDSFLDPAKKGSKPITNGVKSMPQATFTHGYALFIGVGADLPVTVKDATGLRDVFSDSARAAYPPTQVELLTEQQASRQHILAAFDRLIQRTSNDPEATVLVYFSGHGGRILHNGQETEYFLVPYGYDPAQRSTSTVSGQEFTEKIEAIRARKLVVMLDCCHAGGVSMIKDISETFEKAPLPANLLNALESGSGRVIIASSLASEVSYTGSPYSAFTACLIDALAGKASVSKDGYAHILDVLSYLFTQVPVRTDNKQHPFVNKILNLNDNFPLCYYAGGSKEVPGEVPISSTPATSLGMTPGRRRQLEEDHKTLQQSIKIKNLQINALQQAVDLENDPLTKVKYTQQLLQERDNRTHLNDELETIELKLQ